MPQVNDIIDNSAPILDSQVQSGDAIEQWSRNLDTIASQSAERDAALRSVLQQAAPTLDQVNAVFSDVRDALPQTLANLAVVIDMLKRYNKGVEQALVIYRRARRCRQTGSIFEGRGPAAFRPVHQPAAAMLTGFLPASEWRAPADTSTAPLPSGTYCKIPKDFQANVVRGARNYPCADVPGKRAATPKECRSDEPYVPLGHQPLVRRPEPDRGLPCAGRALRPEGGPRSGGARAVGEQRNESAARRSAAAA